MYLQTLYKNYEWLNSNALNLLNCVFYRRSFRKMRRKTNFEMNFGIRDMAMQRRSILAVEGNIMEEKKI